MQAVPQALLLPSASPPRYQPPRPALRAADQQQIRVSLGLMHAGRLAGRQGALSAASAWDVPAIIAAATIVRKIGIAPPFCDLPSSTGAFWIARFANRRHKPVVIVRNYRLRFAARQSCSLFVSAGHLKRL